jgi:hypothetical protein
MTSNANGPERTRQTIQQKLEALRLAEAKIHQARRKKRVSGLITIGGTVVAEAADLVSFQDWLHQLWLRTDPRAREAIEIAADPVDVTRPPPKPAVPPRPAAPATHNMATNDMAMSTSSKSADDVVPHSAVMQGPQPQHPAQSTTQPTPPNTRSPIGAAVQQTTSPPAAPTRTSDSGV